MVEVEIETPQVDGEIHHADMSVDEYNAMYNQEAIINKDTSGQMTHGYKNTVYRADKDNNICFKIDIEME